MMQMPMGQYRPGNTFFHRADAKGKLLGLCLVIAAVIVSKGLIGCIAPAAAALTVSYLAGISLREQIKQQKGMCRFLAVIFLMNAFFYSGEHCIWSWWIFRLSREGIRQGAMVVVHLILILVFCMVLTITTEPMEITWAGGAAFTAFEGRCSDGRNRDDSGGCNAVYPGAGRGSGDNPDGADCTRGSV